MKMKDVLGISMKNIRVYFRRNLMIMAVMGVIFGLVLAMNLWFQGMERAYSELASRGTGGKVIITATNYTGGIGSGEPMVTRQEMVEDIIAHGGEVLGNAEEFGMFGSVVLPEELVRGMIEVNMTTVPEGYAPVLATTFLGEQLLGKSFSAERNKAVQGEKEYDEYREELIGRSFVDKSGAKYYVVGLTAGNFQTRDLSFQRLERRNNNLLNPILEMVATPVGRPIVVDNGKSESWEAGEKMENEWLSGMQEIETVVAVFPDNEKAYEYFRNGKGMFANTSFSGRSYMVTVVAGMPPETQYMIDGMKMIRRGISVVLGLVAAVVVIFTSIRLVDQDKRNIALYYSLGATAGQVRMIYVCYFLELMVGAAILAFGLASGVVLAFSFLNQELLGIQAALGYNQAAIETVVWYGVDVDTVVIILGMLGMAGVMMVVNWKRVK